MYNMYEKQQFLPLLHIVPDSAQEHSRSNQWVLGFVENPREVQRKRKNLVGQSMGPDPFKWTLVPSVVDICVG